MHAMEWLHVAANHAVAWVFSMIPKTSCMHAILQSSSGSTALDYRNTVSSNLVLRGVNSSPSQKKYVNEPNECFAVLFFYLIFNQ